MLVFLVIGCCALIFYRLGEIEYRRGTLLCIASIAVSFLSPLVIPIRMPFVPILLGQLCLFILLWIYNFFRKGPADW